MARRAGSPDVAALRHRCDIRGLDIARPFWTYCANHPHRSPEPDRIPIGPVYTGNDLTRTVWMPSPDTPEIRDHLLALAAAISPQPSPEYPMGAAKEEVVVWQLGELRERRAIADLRRIAAFDPDAETAFRNRASLVSAAQAALAKIGG
jgi:hypothetical protein